MKSKLTLVAGAGLIGMAVLTGCNSGNSGLPGGGGGGGNQTTYRQIDRLARPVVNEVLATVANNRHLVNDINNPTDDPGELRNDIEAFLSHPQHRRSAAIRNVIKNVLVPDVMIADLSKGSDAGYLGVETGGKVGPLFGGRKLRDDVVDISLYVVFGTAVSDLGLAATDVGGDPADGPTPPLANQPNDAFPGVGDNVGPHTDYLNTFPYLGNPH